jgi:hypothetical protein
MKIAALEYLWWGVSIGGHHYTGEVHHPDGTEEMIRKLSRKEAKELSELEDSLFWPKETNRFETLADLEAAALKWCEKNLGDTWLLLHHNSYNPNHVIGGKGYTKKHLAGIEAYQKWWWSLSEADREKIWKVGSDTWEKLLEPA